MWDQRRARDERRSRRPVVFDAQVLLTSYLFFLNPDRPTGKINPKGKNVFTPYTILWLCNTKVEKKTSFWLLWVFLQHFFPILLGFTFSSRDKNDQNWRTEDNCRVNRNYINSDTEELGGRNFYQNGFKKCIGVHTIHIQFTIHFSPSWYTPKVARVAQREKKSNKVWLKNWI